MASRLPRFSMFEVNVDGVAANLPVEPVKTGPGVVLTVSPCSSIREIWLLHDLPHSPVECVVQASAFGSDAM